MAHGDEGHSHPHEHPKGETRTDDFVAGLQPRNPPLPRRAGVGKTLYIDAFSGVAGDMLVASLLDLGVPVAAVQEAIAGLPMSGYRLELGTRTRHSIRASALRVHVEVPQPQRDYREIREMLDGCSSLSDGARALCQRAFRILAEAEASVHGVAVDAVHFHEVGAVDSIVDTVATCVAIDYLGAEVSCSPLPLSRGFTRSQHGRIPLPAPATALCLRGVPTVASGTDRELVTPTGACLVRAICRDFGPWPAIASERFGFGAGTRDLADRPNLVRLVLGIPTGSTAHTDTVWELQANIDDASGEILGHAIERLMSAGALDCWTSPIGMKKGRPATLLSCLAHPHERERVAQLMLAETTSLGIRARPCQRFVRPRRMVTVSTPFGPIAVKVADGDGLPANVAPEYEACRASAEQHGVPVKQVLQAALSAAWGLLAQPNPGDELDITQGH